MTNPLEPGGGTFDVKSSAEARCKVQILYIRIVSSAIFFFTTENYTSMKYFLRELPLNENLFKIRREEESIYRAFYLLNILCKKNRSHNSHFIFAISPNMQCTLPIFPRKGLSP